MQPLSTYFRLTGIDDIYMYTGRIIKKLMHYVGSITTAQSLGTGAMKNVKKAVVLKVKEYIWGEIIIKS